VSSLFLFLYLSLSLIFCLFSLFAFNVSVLWFRNSSVVRTLMCCFIIDQEEKENSVTTDSVLLGRRLSLAEKIATMMPGVVNPGTTGQDMFCRTQKGGHKRAGYVWPYDDLP
jgi:hypothetical protein